MGEEKNKKWRRKTGKKGDKRKGQGEGGSRRETEVKTSRVRALTSHTSTHTCRQR